MNVITGIFVQQPYQHSSIAVPAHQLKSRTHYQARDRSSTNNRRAVTTYREASHTSEKAGRRRSEDQIIQGVCVFELKVASRTYGIAVAFEALKRAATTLIFTVLVDDIAQFAELSAKYGRARTEFLKALKNQRRLVLEGTVGDRGCLMLIEAQSVEDVLAVLQNDPYVVEPAPSKVLIRSLEINVFGNTELLLGTKTCGSA